MNFKAYSDIGDSINRPILDCSFSNEQNVDRCCLYLQFLFGASQAYDLRETLLVSTCFSFISSTQQLREYPMLLALTRTSKLIWPGNIAVFICLILYHMKKAMSGYVVLIMS